MLGALLKSLFSRDGAKARAAFDAGVSASHRGEFSAAAESFERALALDPEAGEYHFLAAVAYFSLGKVEQARSRYRSALALDPTLPNLHMTLAQIEMPGPFYVDLLKMLHGHLRPRTYVEVGVESGQTLALVRPETRAIGIDPEPDVKHALTAGTVVNTMTSDDYFARRDLQADLGGLPVDLAFIDGMHHFEFALRDFINIEKHCTPRSTILIHDCYPFDRFTAERERHVTFWSGDIWRLILALRKYRPDLRLHTVAAAPTGLGIVRGLDPRSTILGNNYEDIVREFLATDYSVLDTDKAGKLALFPNDWDRIKAIFH